MKSTPNTEEAANVKKQNLAPPEHGWGDIHLEKARPEVSGAWTDSGEASAEGRLKHREDNVGRSVPCPPALTEILHDHLTRFGTARDGRLFRGARDGGRVSSTVYGRVCAAARAKVFTRPAQPRGAPAGLREVPGRRRTSGARGCRTGIRCLVVVPASFR
ncbi:hypothetical protein GCM10023214_05620 [Amycolatopsis dongchuanensis]|uniref:Uncharacterized protein n=1 Tax=Amycolatopsis dongchuanensis TaxID=1070866 RepID=A0ABP9PVV3_9PSEU